MYHLKHNNKSKNTENKDNKVFRQDHYNNMHKTVEQYKKQNVELQRQVDDLQQLVGERDIEVRDLAYKDSTTWTNPSSTTCTTSSARSSH